MLGGRSFRNSVASPQRNYGRNVPLRLAVRLAEAGGMLRHALVVLTLVAALAGPPAGADVQTSPPVVVATVPAAGERAVDPLLRELRVTFSKDMMTHEMWSFVYANPLPFPEIAGDVRYLPDKRTVVLPVSLKPGTSYGLWINSGEHDSFRDTGQRPAVPYMLVFETRD